MRKKQYFCTIKLKRRKFTMTREEFKQEMMAIVPRYDELRNELRNFGKERFASLNKYFCPTASYPWGVEYITCHCYNGFHCEVKWTTRGGVHGSKTNSVMESENTYYKEKGYDLHSMTEVQMNAVVEFIKNSIAEDEKKLASLYERGSKEPAIEDLEKECERVANELLAGKTNRYGDKMRATLAVGKRGCDHNSDPYTALIIEYHGNEFGKVDWHYYAGFRFYKDKFGINHFKFFKPLCGESDIVFNTDIFKEYIESFTRKND